MVSSGALSAVVMVKIYSVFSSSAVYKVQFWFLPLCKSKIQVYFKFIFHCICPNTHDSYVLLYLQVLVNNQKKHPILPQRVIVEAIPFILR